MKITKRQLTRIIAEEAQHQKDMIKLSEDIRMAYAEHLLLTYPNVLLHEGHITPEAYTRARKMRMLNEAGGVNKKLEEGFFDDVKKMAKKVGEKAVEKGKELGKKGLEKAKEVGNKEIDTKKFAKDASRVGKEAGEMAAGLGQGIWNAMAPMAKKLGSGAAKMAKSAVQSAEKNLPDMLASAEKIVGSAVDSAIKGAKGAAKKGAEVVGDTAHSLAGMIEKAKEGITMEMQAKNSPDAFLATYKALQGKLNDMGVPAGTPDEASASLGIWEAPEGQEALKVGAEKAGVTPQELKSLTALYVAQSKYVDMATKAQGSMSEGLYTRDQLRFVIREALRESQMQAPQSPNEWMDWGDGHGLDPEYDNDGQLIYYTDDPAAAKDAERLGADIEGDRTGQYVIYTNAEMDGPGDAAGDFVDAGIRGREMMKRR